MAGPFLQENRFDAVSINIVIKRHLRRRPRRSQQEQCDHNHESVTVHGHKRPLSPPLVGTEVPISGTLTTGPPSWQCNRYNGENSPLTRKLFSGYAPAGHGGESCMRSVESKSQPLWRSSLTPSERRC